jgi:hypothetical protein
MLAGRGLMVPVDAAHNAKQVLGLSVSLAGGRGRPPGPPRERPDNLRAECEPQRPGQNFLLAIRAPCASAASFAHTTSGSTPPDPT